MQRLVSAVVLLAAIAAAAGADTLRLLDDPREAAQARVDIIQQARFEIDALYFLARDDRITFTALSLLRDARRRGVADVRLVVDASFQHIPKAVLAHLREEGVQVRVYHPLTLRHPSWIFRRMHEKVVVVDGERYITGGRNLAEAYFGLTRRNYVDRDIYVEGPSAAMVDAHFDELWESRDLVDLRVRVSDAEKRSAARLLDAAPLTLAGQGFIELSSGCDWAEGEEEIASVGFLHDPLPGAGGPRVAARLAEIIEDAKSSIVIESPYLVPSRPLYDLLKKKAAVGVSIVIVTNSLRSTDGVLPYAGYLRHRRRLLLAGVDIREYKGPDMLHAKSMVVDGRVVLVGSYNLDPRSQNLNAEAMCVAQDEGLARELLASIDRHAANAWTLRRNGLPAHGERRPRISRARSLRLWAARLLLPLIERQL
jgi:phosphatidylserine/phosphatidylglycerophosphate/cardiolipin synthase-like enzyme